LRLAARSRSLLAGKDANTADCDFLKALHHVRGGARAV
jgi:hypothetical protein